MLVEPALHGLGRPASGDRAAPAGDGGGPVTESLTRQLLAAVLSWRFEDLEPEDIEAVRRLLMDHLAVAVWGAQTDAGRIMREHVMGDRPGSGGPPLPIPGTLCEAPAVAAAMATSVAAAAYEYDDTHTAGSLHPGVVIFPAATAAAAISGCDERTLLRAVVAGYEVMCRVGLAVNPQAHRARHFQPTATTGHFGAAATTSVCLGLDLDRAVAALSLAGTVAGGSMQFLTEGAWTKQVHPAFAVERGVEAAQLAGRGFPGVRDPIAGERAFLAAQSAEPRPDLLLAGLGSVPRQIRNTGIKPYPSCRNTQPPLDALLELRRRDGLSEDEVEAVEFGLVRPGIATVWDPVDRTRRPRSLVEAQFSLPFVAAVAIRKGRVSLEHFTQERITDPSLQPLIDRIGCVHDPELDRRYPESFPSWVTVRTHARGVLKASVENPHGDPGSPLSERELLDKLADSARGIFDAEQLAEIAAAVRTFPEPGSWPRLLDLLRPVTG